MARGRVLLFVGVLLVSAGCDQATKRLAIDRLEGAPPISLAGEMVRFELTANPGGFLSLGSGLPSELRRLVFLVLAPACLLLVCALALRSGSVSAATIAGLGLIAGGGLGNWLDRFQAGVVTDFVSLGVGGLRTGIFNVADVAVVAGVVWLACARSDGPSRRSPSECPGAEGPEA